jgi:hypothetical protein
MAAGFVVDSRCYERRNTMHFNLDHAISVLTSTPQVLRAMLQNLPSELTASNEGGETWSPFDVIGHLIHGERTDWIPRLNIILQHGESQPFEPFDRFAQFEASKGRTLGELLDTFERLRADSVDALKGSNLGPEDLAKVGKHPELGRVTAEELIATWVVHDLGHINQITRTMAKQYRGAVGPWQAYLSVLK